MPARRNKKVLCVIDEFGTADAGELYLGAVMLSAAMAGRIDKQFSDLLEPSAAELHAVRLDPAYVQGLLERLQQVPGTAEVLLVNRKVTHRRQWAGDLRPRRRRAGDDHGKSLQTRGRTPAGP